MAKALLGHVGIGADPRLGAEMALLRRRVRDLEAEVARLREANRELAGVHLHDDLLDLNVGASEPALT